MSQPSSPRNGADRCPGLLRPHLAADGAIVRIRLPGGRISAAALGQLADAARAFANGEVQLTSRANLQLRGVPVDDRGDVPDALVDAVRAAGLLPSDTAELVRNILCSPMTGRVGGTDLRPVVDRLDELLRTSPPLTALSGRFFFGLDDGSADIADLGCDVGIIARPDGGAELIAAGHRGPVVPLDAAADWLVRMALTFLAGRGDDAASCWHVAELPGGGAALLAAVFDDVGATAPAVATILPAAAVSAATPAAVEGAAAAKRFGPHRQTDGRSLLSLVVPLGRLTAPQIRAVLAAARYGSGELVVTPWNGLIVTDLPMSVGSPEILEVAAMLADAGLPSTADSGWIGVSACTGAPGCARGAGPTAPVATRLALRTGTRAEPVHVVACERRCGAPASAHREVMVEPAGEFSRFRPARTADGPARPPRRNILSPLLSTATSERA